MSRVLTDAGEKMADRERIARLTAVPAADSVIDVGTKVVIPHPVAMAVA
jgi:uncharacterized protein YabE (DUF348 family)